MRAILCHCDTCRFTSGQLCTSYLVLAHAPRHLQGLTGYHTSAGVSRLHCSTCGAHVFAHNESSNVFSVASGSLQSAQHVIEVVHHQWVEDTKDGGLSSFLTEVGNCRVSSSLHGADSGQGDQRQSWPLVPRENSLHGRCHCGGVEYFVTPPTSASRDLSSPWPDLLVPYHSGSSANIADAKWWLRSNDTKFTAGNCTCRSCRLASGFPIQSWAFIPKCNILQPDNTPLDFKLGTLRRYESSPGVYREFCACCGATVFWHCEERPDLIDVSIGLLRANTGVRAENWLEWVSDRVSFVEEAVDKDLATSLERGLKR